MFLFSDHNPQEHFSFTHNFFDYAKWIQNNSLLRGSKVSMTCCFDSCIRLCCTKHQHTHIEIWNIMFHYDLGFKQLYNKITEMIMETVLLQNALILSCLYIIFLFTGGICMPKSTNSPGCGMFMRFSGNMCPMLVREVRLLQPAGLNSAAWVQFVDLWITIFNPVTANIEKWIINKIGCLAEGFGNVKEQINLTAESKWCL